MTTKSEQQVFTLSTHITTEWNKRRVNSIKTQLTIICTASKTTSFGFNNLIERLNTKVFLFLFFFLHKILSEDHEHLIYFSQVALYNFCHFSQLTTFPSIYLLLYISSWYYLNV